MPESETPFQLAWIDKEPPSMAAAIRMAHETFDEFRRQVELENFRRLPAFGDIVVKVRVMDRQTGRCEYVFLSRPVISKITIDGILASQPQIVKEWKPGHSMDVPHANLADWFLLTGNRGIGGFTVDVLKADIPFDQLPKYTSQPPVSWFNHRKGSAIEWYRRIPVCTKCGQRELVAESYADGICGLCRNGGKRTNCSACRVPLFRYPGAPDKCYTCVYGKSRVPARGAAGFTGRKWWEIWKK